MENGEVTAMSADNAAVRTISEWNKEEENDIGDVWKQN